MGISDEDYGTALIELKKLKALSSEQAKAIVETVDKYATGWSDPRSVYPTTVSTTPSGSKVLNEQDLQHDAMKAPLSALIDMWTSVGQASGLVKLSFKRMTFGA